jgi:hypothetical protein
MAPESDQTPIILARMETKLDRALADIDAQRSLSQRHDGTLIDHGNRIVALETWQAAAKAADAKTWSSRSVLWVALGSVAAIIAVVLAIHGGGLNR